ncbi:hypothetical protein [Frankia sp. AgKG'84/4]|uniref:hypothetical protein n=1 Tax=Frankia sp. AgKG'84/4 TaxID=573490 RepID=UPI00200D639F|nr:hypothetical protein [Frankia sp. AgKG'84/4]MCL9793934.1 hypothetical protein [Frankia sp. AgKG'84/4]
MSVPRIDHTGPWALARLTDPGGGPFPALVARDRALDLSAVRPLAAYGSTVSTLRGRLLRAGDVTDSTITGLDARSNRCVAETAVLKQNGTRP